MWYGFHRDRLFDGSSVLLKRKSQVGIAETAHRGPGFRRPGF